MSNRVGIKGALVILPALDEYERVQAAKVIPLRIESDGFTHGKIQPAQSMR